MYRGDILSNLSLVGGHQVIDLSNLEVKNNRSKIISFNLEEMKEESKTQEALGCIRANQIRQVSTYELLI